MIKKGFKGSGWILWIPGLRLTLLLLVLTVVGNCHCYEGTNGLKNLSTWQRNLLKPHTYAWKNWHTNALPLFYKTKCERSREKKQWRCSGFQNKMVSTMQKDSNSFLPFCGLLTHPQRALHTDVQNWMLWLAFVLALLRISSGGLGNLILKKQQCINTFCLKMLSWLHYFGNYTVPE